MEKVLAVAGVITALSAAGTVVWAVLRWGHRISEGAKCQLRSEMLRTYYHHYDTKTMRQYEYENFVYCYEAYSALGGNSFILKIKQEVDKWKIVS